ncbi:DUF3623 domain-containing protein [Fertoebacter nigrum]|uniref:DUF3623 domain-containing protein n=1 Tax=Fertoeibacter niger TaxID=2656921 RepID=A0A8X8KNB2_9RHOB|nr:putative photosynthetic complex assembly protein PuhE [Fertoeibacter niger]NUB43596.1 DUF3623 domain-containing protein [Fertoeibacter niger]
MLANPWIAALSALFLWWFSTGILLWRVRQADNAGREAHLWSVLLGLPLLFAGVLGFLHTRGDASLTGIYGAFLSALAIWGWIELAFLSGVITGPNRSPCPRHATPMQRFLRATGTILWHECLLIATLAIMAMQAQGAANRFAFYTFMVLFFARISAKLNLFFGVPHINTEFLPTTLAHLPSHFRHARMNALFPLSITALTFATACWVERAVTATDPGQSTGFWLLTALTALAALEHWFMVLPLPDQKLWRWMMPAPAPSLATPQPDLRKEPTHGL